MVSRSAIGEPYGGVGGGIGGECAVWRWRRHGRMIFSVVGAFVWAARVDVIEWARFGIEEVRDGRVAIGLCGEYLK